MFLLRVFASITIVSYILTMPMIILSKIILLILITAVLVLNFYIWIRIRVKGSPGYLEHTGPFSDIAVIMVLSASWYFASENDFLHPAYLSKTMLTPLCMLFILLNSFTSLRKNIIITAAGSLIIHFGLIISALTVKSINISFNLKDIILPDTVILNLLIFRTIIVAVFGAAVYYFSINWTKLIYRSTSLENTCTQLQKYFSTQDSHRFLPGFKDIFSSSVNSGNAAVMITGIRDFAVMNETYTPEDIFYILSGYYAIISETVFRFHGAIINSKSDEFTAVFGISSPSGEEKNNCVSCAVEISDQLEEFNETLFRKNLIPVKVLTGIHFGRISSSNIGTQDRFEYAVIGEGISVASKLKLACRKSGKHILISESVKESVNEFFTCIPAGKIASRKKDQPIRFYNVISGHDE